MIIDFNRESIPVGTEFHFQHSLRRFIHVTDGYDNDFFVDLDEGKLYDLESLSYDELDFYRKDDDEDFMGVNTDW